MSILSLSMQGRFGNTCMQFLFAYAFAEKHGMEFQCPKWIGERIFDLPKYARPSRTDFRRVNEFTIFDPCLDTSKPYYDDREFRGYAQMRGCMIYTKTEAQAWLKIKPEIAELCQANIGDAPATHPTVAHIRRGDYFGYGYPVLTLESYRVACDEFGLSWPDVQVLTEEHPTPHDGLPDDLGFMPDFYRMVTAKTLLRGNSSFSWLAALLGDGLVLAPVVDGLEGGREHYCRFVAGNHPKFAPHLDFVTNLHVAP